MRTGYFNGQSVLSSDEEEEEDNFILSRLEVQQITLACVTLLLRLCILTIWLR